jgi:hypothetical protein
MVGIHTDMLGIHTDMLGIREQGGNDLHHKYDDNKVHLHP